MSSDYKRLVSTGFVFVFSTIVLLPRAHTQTEVAIPAPPVESKPKGRPVWQFGFGAGGGVSPHYPASDQSSLRFLATPTFRYRGKILRADDEGTRARLLKFEDSEVDLSGAASFPVGSGDNEARIGMPELDWIGEVGPRIGLRWRVGATEKSKGDLVRVQFPFRAVFTSGGSDLAHRGFTFQPEISFERVLSRSNALDTEISVELDTSISFISEDLANYFYGVKPEFQTAKRRTFDGKAGPLSVSTGLMFFLSPRSGVTEGSSFFVGVRNNASVISANRDSPLHKTDQTLSFLVGVNVYWINSEARDTGDTEATTKPQSDTITQ